ncbi:hypothetical protein Dimus_036370, partial [Dionaea muscipula]
LNPLLLSRSVDDGSTRYSVETATIGGDARARRQDAGARRKRVRGGAVRALRQCSRRSRVDDGR